MFLNCMIKRAYLGESDLIYVFYQTCCEGWAASTAYYSISTLYLVVADPSGARSNA